MQKSAKIHCKKYKIFGAQDVFFCFNGNYSICMLNKSESAHTGVPHSYLDQIYTLMWDDQQFICCYCNFTTLKLEANNVKTNTNV